MKSLDEIDSLLAELENELATLDARKSELLKQIAQLRQEKALLVDAHTTDPTIKKSTGVTNQSTQEDKITLYRSRFRGREDIYPR